MLPDGLREVLSRIERIQATVAAMAPPAAAGAASREAAATFDGAMQEASKAQGLDPALVRAVVSAESGGDPNSVSPAGAQGLMQLMPATARDMGIKNPLDPAENLKGGTRYLREMIDRFGSLPEALAAYNAGPGAVERHQGIPPFPETQHYVQRVMKLYEANQEGLR